jgi:predicted GIY-YIG superfamily endonuclease
MHPAFEHSISGLEGKCAHLLKTDPIDVSNTKNMPLGAGVYVISENHKDLYTGRTNNIRKRLWNHCHGAPNQAPLAKQLARLYLNRAGVELPSAYRKGNKEFYKTDAVFCAAFNAAKKSIASMSFRFVEEAEAIP